MNFLIVGGGSIGKRHIKNLHALGYHNITCLKRHFDPSFSSQYAVNVITNIEDSLSLNIDAIFVCNPTSLHHTIFEFAVIHNIALFMEKPFVANKDQLEYVKKISSNYNQVFYLAYMLRQHPQLKQIKTLIENKIIGRIFSANFEFGSFLPNWHPNEDYKQGYAAKTNLGGGVLNTISHEIDLIYYFFNQPYSVYSLNRNLNILGIEAEEMVDSLIEYTDFTVNLHLDYLQKDYSRNLVLRGENGTIKWDWASNNIILKVFSHEEKVISLNQFDVNQLYIDELKEFILLLKNKVSSHPLNLNYALKNADLLNAMQESSNTQKRILTNE